MKSMISWGAVLLSITLNAQRMNTPQETVTRLFIATDQQDWDQVSQSFATDVLLDYSSMNGSPAATLTPEQIISAWKGILPGFEQTHHQVGNFISSENGERAEVFCYGTATHYLTHKNGNVWTVVGSYDFGLSKAAGAWKITSMKFNFKYQDGNTALPQHAINQLK